MRDLQKITTRLCSDEAVEAGWIKTTERRRRAVEGPRPFGMASISAGDAVGYHLLGTLEGHP